VCGSIVDIQSATTDNRHGKNKKKPHRQNIMACPLPCKGSHKKKIETAAAKYNGLPYWVAIKKKN